jgi:putative transposase
MRHERLMDIEVEAADRRGHGSALGRGRTSATATGRASGIPGPARIGLEIPKLRKGSYFPTFLEPRRTAEKASWR